MATEVAHQWGTAVVQGDELVLRIAARIGALGGHEAEEQLIPLSEIEEILIRFGHKPEMVFRSADQLLGLRLRYQKIGGLDGVDYSPARRLAEEITAVNPGVRVSEVTSFDKTGVTWLEAGKKVGYWKNLGNSLKAQQQARQAQQARSGTEPQVADKQYKDAKAYERDARTMLAQGWRMEGQSSTQGKVRMGRTVLKAGVFLPWAVMRPSRKGAPITVTWLRGGDLVEVEAPPVQAPQSVAVPSGDDVPAQIRKLAELRDSGILTDEEFAAKKGELLARM
jgi:hypothetical protein